MKTPYSLLLAAAMLTSATLFVGCKAAGDHTGSVPQETPVSTVEVTSSMKKETAVSKPDAAPRATDFASVPKNDSKLHSTTEQTAEPQREETDALSGEESFKDFVLRFATFFQMPVGSAAELGTGYNLSSYLMCQTYASHPENTYRLDSRGVCYMIPVKDIQECADVYLGLPSFDVAQITEWQSIPPSGGYCYYSDAAGIPYFSGEILEISKSADNSEITATVRIRNDQYENSDGAEATLHYNFKIIDDENHFCFLSITK